MNEALYFIGSKILAFFDVVGQMCILLVRILSYTGQIFKNRRNILKEMLSIGVNAVPIACVLSFFTGMVLALQTAEQLDRYGIKEVLGSLVGLSIVRELGPVFIALLVAGRAGSAMSAQIGTMAVSDELFALRSMGIDPVRYLAMPKFIASCIMVPLIVIISTICGFFGGALMSNVSVGLDYSTYYDSLFKTLVWQDYFGSLLKSLIFGATICVVSCTEGFKTEGGAEQVGESTTKAVVISFIAVFILDYFVTKLLIIVF